MGQISSSYNVETTVSGYWEDMTNGQR
jgi:hypothetical protein